MATPSALIVALKLMEHPANVRQWKDARLPDGVSAVLAVAAGHEHALRDACASTGRNEQALRSAAGFFIEQLLFTPQADAYRVLGADQGATRKLLRHHMVLLMQWLHPDRRLRPAANGEFDRSVFIHRVTQAWQALKTPESRASYDRSRRDIPQATPAATPPSMPEAIAPARFKRKSRKSFWPQLSGMRLSRTVRAMRKEAGSTPPLVMFRLARDPLFARLFLYWKERQ